MKTNRFDNGRELLIKFVIFSAVNIFRQRYGCRITTEDICRLKLITKSQVTCDEELFISRLEIQVRLLYLSATFNSYTDSK